MKRSIFFLAVLSGICFSSGAQVLSPDTPNDGVYKKDAIRERQPIPYAPLREADVMWKKRVWRVIDLREKMNLPLYYPLVETNGMRSLADLLYNAVMTEGSPRIFKGGVDDFSEIMTITELKNFVEKVDTMYVPDLDNPDNPPVMKVVPRKFEPSRVKKIWVKEEWFFDKQRSVLDCRILGICPMYENEDKEKGDTPLFWIYFPEARPLLAKYDVFNRFNPSERRSFDDIFWKRQFSSYITKEENVYDRVIGDYAKGMDALLESERIKQEIVNFEHDLWEF
ncbi:MAG: gliding motility protein GldN [Bacteroidia bacterium]|nr:gliding motility protein GldN [Bacteroidia bacterium]MCC6769090.1 gliding motility protein GldN [Bacteroidia bacterium]